MDDFMLKIAEMVVQISRLSEIILDRNPQLQNGLLNYAKKKNRDLKCPTP